MESVRGLTNYQDEHSFGNAAIQMMKNQLILGILPIDRKCVHWFLSGPGTLRARDYGVSRDPLLIRETTLYDVKEFPAETVEMIKNSDPASLSYTPIKYRAPWDLLLGHHGGSRRCNACDGALPRAGRSCRIGRRCGSRQMLGRSDVHQQ
eukprot:TRINITY_DN1905_c0_g1_i3.p1 TRINITY_DN1905_c0_g1~~TRINITY_DN1905_c0_g1_i3.p1  ORF type:complete len:150 (+),score=29.86 TRINITY_DN1905_c0_g1_i3:961-1410(+)